MVKVYRTILFVLYCFFNLIVIEIFHYLSYISAFTYLFILLICNKFILKESAGKVTFSGLVLAIGLNGVSGVQYLVPTKSKKNLPFR